MKKVVLVVAIVFAGALAVGLFLMNATETDQRDIKKLKTLMLKPGKAHEVCMILTPDDGLRYEFYVVGSLDFDLHYHLRDKVFYSVKPHGASRENKVFRPTFSNDYCLMWVNNHAGPISFKFGYEKIKTAGGP